MAIPLKEDAIVNIQYQAGYFKEAESLHNQGEEIITLPM